MANDRAVGAIIFVGGILGIIIYGVLEYYWESEVLAITAFLGIALLLGILSWIGYTMATTPPPEPITDIPDVPPAKHESGSPEKQG